MDRGKMYPYKPKGKTLVFGQMPEMPWKVKRPWYKRLARWFRRIIKNGR